MLADGRESRDVVTQLSAAIKALEQVGFRLIASGLTPSASRTLKRQRSPAIPSTKFNDSSRNWRDVKWVATETKRRRHEQGIGFPS